MPEPTSGMQLVQSPRAIGLASIACLVLGAIACGSEPVAEVAIAPIASEPSVVVAAPPDVDPAHGGTVVMAGAYPVEVTAHESGEIYAYVLDATPPPPDAELTVVVPVRGGVRTVELSWDPGQTRWAGRIRRTEVVTGPLDVIVVVGEERWVGHTTNFVLLPAIVVVAPAVSAPAPVIVVEPPRGKHRKHRGHRGRGRRGRGGVEIRIGH